MLSGLKSKRLIQLLQSLNKRGIKNYHNQVIIILKKEKRGGHK